MTHLDEKALEAANDLAREEFGVMVGSVGPAYITAYLSALLPEDAAGLVERLRESAEHLQEYVAEVGPWPSTYKHCAAIIQSQAAGWAADKARIAELEAVLARMIFLAEVEHVCLLAWNKVGSSANYDGIMADARALLKGESKG